MDCVLSADIGTSSLKAALITECGDVLAQAKRKFSPDVTAQDWLEAWVGVYRELVNWLSSNVSTKSYEIVAICISGNGPTLVATGGTDCTDNRDSTRNKLDELFLWNLAIPSDIAETMQTHSIFIPRLLAFKTMREKIFSQAEKIFSSYEYLIYRLTGSQCTVLPEKRFEQPIGLKVN